MLKKHAQKACLKSVFDSELNSKLRGQIKLREIASIQRQTRILKKLDLTVPMLKKQKACLKSMLKKQDLTVLILEKHNRYSAKMHN